MKSYRTVKCSLEIAQMDITLELLWPHERRGTENRAFGKDTSETYPYL